MSLVTPLPDIAPASRSQTMRALVLDTHGGAFRDTLAARPEPGSGAVLVRIAASAVNPLDLKIRAGSAPHAAHPLPNIPGLDMAGSTEERRGGKAGGSPRRAPWSPYHVNKKQRRNILKVGDTTTLN